MRLQCLYCDREDADGVPEAPSGWTEVKEDSWSRKHFESAWWTHSGVCPDCLEALTRDQMQRERLLF